MKLNLRVLSDATDPAENQGQNEWVIMCRYSNLQRSRPSDRHVVLPLDERGLRGLHGFVTSADRNSGRGTLVGEGKIMMLEYHKQRMTSEMGWGGL